MSWNEFRRMTWFWLLLPMWKWCFVKSFHIFCFVRSHFLSLLFFFFAFKLPSCHLIYNNKTETNKQNKRKRIRTTETKLIKKSTHLLDVNVWSHQSALQRNAFKSSAVRPTITTGGATIVRTNNPIPTQRQIIPKRFKSVASVIFTAFAERTRNTTEMLFNANANQYKLPGKRKYEKETETTITIKFVERKSTKKFVHINKKEKKKNDNKIKTMEGKINQKSIKPICRVYTKWHYKTTVVELTFKIMIK